MKFIYESVFQTIERKVQEAHRANRKIIKVVVTREEHDELSREFGHCRFLRFPIREDIQLVRPVEDVPWYQTEQLVEVEIVRDGSGR